MNIGIRLHDLAKGTLEERLKMAADQGFGCGHLAFKKVIDEYSVDNAALTPGFALNIKRMFDTYGLDIAVLGNYLNLATPDMDAYRKNLERYFAHIRIANLLNAGVVGTETGAVNKEYKYEPANHSKEALDLFIERLKPVVECAEKFGVIFAIEPVYKHIVCNPMRARYVLDKVGSPNLQIIFDPVNLLDISNFEARDEIFKEAIDLLGKDIAVLHIKDFEVTEDGLKSIAAGTGLMNYEAILKYMKESKPFIHATLENTTPDNAVAAREYITQIYERV